MGSKCGPGGDNWHLDILQDILKKGIEFNGYNTNINLFADDQGDCFVGGLGKHTSNQRLTDQAPDSVKWRSNWLLDLTDCL